MEVLSKNAILEFEENALEEIRKRHGFDKVERINEAVDILDTWVQKQDHFVVKNFSRRYLEATIMQCKGSIEKAKSKIDKMCTFRTLLPHFFGDFDLRKDFKDFLDYSNVALLPKQAPGLYRVPFIRVRENRFTSNYVTQLVKIGVMIGEYLKVNEYSDGFIFIIDLRDADVVDIVKNTNVVDLKNGVTIYLYGLTLDPSLARKRRQGRRWSEFSHTGEDLEGIAARIKEMHMITESKAIDLLVAILKQALSKKIGDRLSVHKNFEDIYEFVPQEILPVEYGGKAKSLPELQEDLINELSSEEATEYRRFINTARTDETLRQADVFKDEYMGMPGSFRTLSVD